MKAQGILPDMIERLANVAYWIGSAFALLWLFAAFDNAGNAIISAEFFLAGWAIRYILTGNKSFKP